MRDRLAVMVTVVVTLFLVMYYLGEKNNPAKRYSKPNKVRVSRAFNVSAFYNSWVQLAQLA